MCNKIDAVRLNASYWLNLFLLKGQSCVYYISMETKEDKKFKKKFLFNSSFLKGAIVQFVNYFNLICNIL